MDIEKFGWKKGVQRYTLDNGLYVRYVFGYYYILYETDVKNEFNTEGELIKYIIDNELYSIQYKRNLKLNHLGI